MPPSRRDFNRLIAALIATGAAGCSNAEIEDTSTPTLEETTPVETETPLPEYQCIAPPDEPSPDPIFKEAYGDVVLTDDAPENQYCIWTVESDECFELSYEARVTGSNDGWLDILAVPNETKEKYVDKLHVESTDPIKKRIEKAENSFIQIEDFIEPLTRKGVTNREYRQDLSTRSAVLQPGKYHLIFDHTDIGGHKTEDFVTGRASIWARNLVDEQVEKETKDILQQFYSELPSGTKDTIQTLNGLGESVCQELSLEYGSTDLRNIEDSPAETYQVASAASKLLELIEKGTDFESGRLNAVISNASTWTQRGVAVVPLLGSISEVYDTACTLSTQQAVPTTEQVQDLLLSLTMFIVELILTYYGVTSKIARLVVTAMDKYLLGLLKQTLGLEIYIFLLRESLLLLYDDIELVLSTIEGLTEDIDELNAEFFTDEEKNKVDSLDSRQDLFDIEFLDNSHTCTPE